MTEITPSSNRELAQELRRLVRVVQLTGRAILPSSNEELLQSIVQAAARIFGAAAASIALVDEREQKIVFRVAYGAGREQVVGMKIPIDKGIAGYVVNTGQPMAISDVQQDARFNQQAAEKTGYVPSSILAMPLLLNDRVIGVMEVLDKINAPAFGMEDMELLGLFAEQAAIAIHQSQQLDNLNQVLARSIAQLVATDDAMDAAEILHTLKQEADETKCPEVFELADLFHSLSQVGDAERRMCLEIMTTFANYNHAKNQLD